MIQIKPDNVGLLVKKHSGALAPECLERFAFMEKCVRVILGTLPVANLTSTLVWQTETAIVNRFLKSSKKIKSMSGSSSLTTITNVKADIRKNLHSIQALHAYFTRTRVDEILEATPDRLEQLEIDAVNATSIDYSNKDVKKLVSIVFHYSGFGSGSYNAYHLLIAIDVRTCPYCNRLYTTTVKDEAKPPIDHFYDQSNHPLLGLSFYNLIPSCDPCNSRFKLAKTFRYDTHIHPYIENFGSDAVFDYTFLGMKSGKLNAENYLISIEAKSADLNRNKRITKNIEVFKLKQVYECHSDVVVEVVGRMDRESDFHINDLLSRHKGLTATYEQAYRFYFGNYFQPDDHYKRPLAKLTRDIFDKESKIRPRIIAP